ncbi:hypothetical protein TrVE_jg12245 [Triparma verrucosa]|uniref:ABC transporter domain-containing protein n=1 Tax=Triparma verrucosa TaxID=1606542 RepID=A0A9W7CFC4_9STRA|nr:hypothetical protein TrVE_jg12245 [Triparma verrucosa]
MCQHRGLWYIGGQFNRFGDQEAKSFVVLDEDFKTLFIGQVGSNSRLELVRQQEHLSNDRKNYLSSIANVVCDEADDYVYIVGMFRNVTNPWIPSELAVYEEIAEKDETYVIPDPPELVVNNIARFNVTSRRFETIGPHQTEGEQDYYNLNQIGIANQNGDPALVRSIDCIGKGEFKCDKMHVGGTFHTVFGQIANGFAEFSYDRTNRTVFNVTEIKPITSGVVTTSQQLTPDIIFYGGIFGPEGEETSAPPSIKLLTKFGDKCPISAAMQNLPQCNVAKPPYLCCENFFGPAFSSLMVGPEEFLVGGDFSNPLEFEYLGAFPGPNDIPDWEDNWIDPGNNPFRNFTIDDDGSEGGSRRRRLADTEMGLGYQNLIMVPIPTYDDTGALKRQNVTTRWNGGPNGAVIAMHCVTKDEDRCTKIIIGGEFTQWDMFTIDEQLNQDSKPIVYAPTNMLYLIWNAGEGHYSPQSLFDSDELSQDSFDFVGQLAASKGKISAIASTGEMILAGGSFAYKNNLLVYNSTNQTFSGLPKVPTVPLPGDIFYDCMQTAVNSKSGTMEYVGADTCCRKSSYCPRKGVDMACPNDWGYRCTSSWVGICKEGYYCPTPGDKIICPVGHICPYGAVETTKCLWFEICDKEGMTRPATNTGLIFAALVLGLIGFMVFVGSRFEAWSQRRGKFNIEKHFHERFNAFKSALDSADGPAIEITAKLREEAEAQAPDRTSIIGARRSIIGTNNSFGTDSQSDGNSRSSRSASVAPPSDCRIDLTFTNLTVTLANGLKILNGVTGELKSGTMTAIMGPSGCGKSTFMNALTYRIRDGGKVGGEILINGQKKHLMTIQHVVGFVPQEDVMHRDLSVRENLRFYLRLKGDPNLTRVQRRSFVNEIVDILGLAHVQHSLIGDELRRGVSGGQRKRVNIAIELMGSPLVLFLDEPTSGLDATTSQQLIDSLEKLAEIGLTIAMVIHQPRIELLNKIQNLVLLQRGGWPVYVGDTQEGLPYFEKYLGLKLPEKTSPADFFLDIITLDQKVEDDGNKVLKLPHGNDLHENWKEYVKNVKGGSAIPKTDYSQRSIPPRCRPTRIAQAKVYYLRSIRQIQNNKKVYFVDACLLIFAGTLAGFVAKNIMVGNQMVMTVNGLIAIMNALRVFGPEKAIFRREMQSGISSSSYFVGKCLSQIPLLLFTPCFFLSTFYRLSFPEMFFRDLYIIIFCVLFSGTGIGYFLSMLVDPKGAQIAGVVFGLIAIMTCGLNPSLRDLESTSFGWFMCQVTYGPLTMAALFMRGSIRTFKAGFKEGIGSTFWRGYHEIDPDNIYTEEDIYYSRELLREATDGKLKALLWQGAVYMFLTYLVILYLAKAEVGGFFVQVTQSRQARVVKAACEKFWIGRKKTRLEEDEEDEEVVDGDDVVLGKGASVRAMNYGDNNKV